VIADRAHVLDLKVATDDSVLGPIAVREGGTKASGGEVDGHIASRQAGARRRGEINVALNVPSDKSASAAIATGNCGDSQVRRCHPIEGVDEPDAARVLYLKLIEARTQYSERDSGVI
jgi:hypothetical protein